MPKIRVAVVDDHEVVRYGLRACLEREADILVVGEAGTGPDAVSVARETEPDVMVLDARLDDIEGPEVCRQVLEVSPRTSVLMLSNYPHDALVLRSLLAGAKGYVLKDVELAELKRMIRSVYQGHSVLQPRVAAKVISAAIGEARRTAAPADAAKHTVLLSETDLAIVRGLSQGMTSREVAAQVHLSPHTVKDHVERICEVLGVRSRIEMVAEALRRGLI